jgi:predicted RNA binding protein YcfA (HicA-like mRNA interferase family)
VPAILGCAVQGETIDELMANLHEAFEGCLAVDVVERRTTARTAFWISPFETVVRSRVRALAGARRGWQLMRVHCRHHIYGNRGSVVRLSVPIRGSKPLKTGLLRHLARLAAIPDSEIR